MLVLPRIDEIVLHTGQHYDRELSQLFFEELRLPEPAYRLAAGARKRDEMLQLPRDGCRRRPRPRAP
jgi:UDP-N-acetylglucosamine 2-epimerase